MVGGTFSVILAALLSSAHVDAAAVSCFGRLSCSGEAASSGEHEETCCSAQLSYLTDAGVCCNCSEDLQVKFSSSVYTVSEGAGLFSVVIQRCGQFEQEVNILLTYQDVTAEGGRDYGPFPTRTLTLPATIPVNSSDFRFPINIRDNNIVEDPRTFRVSLAIQGEDLTAVGQLPGRSSIVTIADDDFVTVSVEPTTFTVEESAADNNELVFTLRKVGVAVRDVKVALVSSSSGTSTAGQDYEALRAEVIFAPEEDAINVTFTVLDDDIVEAPEDVRLVLMPGDGERGVFFPAAMGAVSGVIQDDNDTVSVFLQEDVSVTESEGKARVVVFKDGDSERNVSVLVGIATPSSTLGLTLATEGRDYNISKGEQKITFGRDEDVKILTLDVYEDGIFERPEMFYLKLEPEAGEAAVLVPPQPTGVQLEDSDRVYIGFSRMASTISEADGVVAVTAELLHGMLEVPVSLDVLVFRESGDLAKEGVDFSLLNSSISFIPGGSRVVTLFILIMDDPFFEGREDFTLQLHSIAPRVNVTTPSTKVSVVDNEDLDIRFQNSTYVVSERRPFLDVEVTLLARIERNITLDLMTSNGTAIAGADYVAISRTLTFTPAITTREVRVGLLDDRQSEGVEDFTLAIELVDETLGEPGVISRATVEILDDERIFVELTAMELYVTEGRDKFAVIVVRKSGQTEQDIDIVLSVTDGSAIGGQDYGFFPAPSLNFTLSIPASESQLTYPIIIRDDNAIEPRENFSVTLLLPDKGVALGNLLIRAIDKTTVFIVDGDVVNLELEPGVVSVEETNSELTFSLVRLDTHTIDPKLGSVDFSVLTVAGSANASLDYVANSVSLKLTDSSPRSFSFNVTLLDDGVAEMSEQFSVVIRPEPTSMTHFTSDEIKSTVTITDNDAVTVDFTLPLYEVIESSGHAIVCLEKDRDTSVPFSVTVTPFETTPTIEDTYQARAGFDFDPKPLEAVFMPDLGMACVDILIIKDQQVGESKEMFGVRVVMPAAAAPSIQASTGARALTAVVVNDVPDVVFGFAGAAISVPEFVGEVEVCLVIFSPSPIESLEATLLVSVQAVVTPESADESDFDLLESSVLFNGTSEECFPIQIVNDNSFEGSSEVVEIVVASFNLSDSSLTAMPSRPSTELVILDDDRSVTVGFSEDSLSFVVDEGVGAVSLCVGIISPGPSVQFDSQLEIVVGTQAQTATSADFTPISAVSADVILVLNSTEREACFDVGIIDDDTFEEREMFEVFLTSLYGDRTDVEDVFVEPSRAVVAIIDNDVQVFVGFEEVMVVVREDVTVVTLCAVVDITGKNQTIEGFTVRVNVLFGGGADGYLQMSSVLYFNSTQRKSCFDVSFDDLPPSAPGLEMMTPSSEFFLQLQLPPGSPLGVVVAMNRSILNLRFTEVTSTVMLELISTVMPEVTRTVMPEVTSTVMPEVTRTVMPKVTSTVMPELMSTVMPEVTRTVMPEVTSTVMPEVTRTVMPEVTSTVMPEVTSTVMPEVTRTVMPEVTSTVMPEVTRTVMPEVTSTVMPEVTSTVMPELMSTVMPEVMTTEMPEVTSTEVPEVTSTEVPEVMTTEMPEVMTTEMPEVTSTEVPEVMTTEMPEVMTTEKPTIFPILANGSISGETIFSVPLSFDEEDFQHLPVESMDTVPHLCYEIHGKAGSYFNLLSDTCTSVNAEYKAAFDEDVPIFLNVISRIGIVTKNSNGSCVSIEVSVDNRCMPLVSREGPGGSLMTHPVEAAEYKSSGISVTRRLTHVRISVPNCGSTRLVMYAACITSEDSGASTIRFDITRGINLSPTSHGLMGQFWNVPVDIQPYTYESNEPTYLDTNNLFAITVMPPESAPRKFVAEYYDKRWDQTLGTCFYAGNIQGGSLLEISSDPEFNAPVIEGNYLDYKTSGLFNYAFKFSKFLNTTCTAV